LTVYYYVHILKNYVTDDLGWANHHLLVLAEAPIELITVFAIKISIY